MLQQSLYCPFKCLRCRQAARLHKFYRLCYHCCKESQADPKQAVWLYGNRDVDEDAPTEFRPGSKRKVRLMRRRLLDGLSLFNDGDVGGLDWKQIDVQANFSEAKQRAAGSTGVERDGVNFRARPMAGGVKHNLGEFKSEAEALNVVRWFWVGWLGLDRDETAGMIVANPTKAPPEFGDKQALAEAREKDAAKARDGAIGRRKERQFKEAAEEVTPLFGAALQYC